MAHGFFAFFLARSNDSETPSMGCWNIFLRLRCLQDLACHIGSGKTSTIDLRNRKTSQLV